MASQRGRGACRTMTPLMYRILAVAYPELDGRLKASQQPQGASSGGGALASEQEGAATHMAQEGECTESEGTCWTEGEGSFRTGTGEDTSDSDSSSDVSSLAVAGTSVPTATTGADTCTTGSISAADTAAATATCPATCPASATTADISSIPSGEPFEAAGDVLDPAHTT
ncbi:hypothetical protein NDU88_002699 [Pleurodeles waltl]|uniref:Uncharacterized protein n=1 Tax=Pleurodeles waltl TaxID=8319 RepID=A0AAV7M1C3_PLEWA|nr:hypothetical protein NDU88_002699 [Pleurodeles waltl]